ncbi:hypothetical protein ACOME3_008049 [Neoechinorhynchus agilis]
MVSKDEVVVGRKRFKVDETLPPSVGEMAELRRYEDQGSLDHPAAMNMMINELIGEVSMTRDEIHFVDRFLESLRDELKCLRKRKMREVCWPQLYRRRGLRNEKTIDFKFNPPSNVHVIGSVLNDCYVKRATDSIDVDVALMVSDLFVPSHDHVNLRYHAKKFLYFEKLKNVLEKRSGDWNARIVNKRTYDQLLVLENKKFTNIRAFGYICSQSPKMDAQKFQMDRHNLRDHEGIPLKSIRANNSVLRDVYCIQLNTAIKEKLDDSGRKAVQLLKVFLHQRSLISKGCLTCIDPFVVSVLIGLILNKENRHSPIELFRSFMIFMSEFSSMDLKLVDFPGLNVFARMSRGVLERIKIEARRSIAVLKLLSIDAFKSLFLSTVPIDANYDFVFEMNTGSDLPKSPDYEFRALEAIDELDNLLVKGFKNRMTYGNVVSICDDFRFKYGIVLSDQANVVIEKGPMIRNANDCEEFRRIWKNETEIRKLKDGSIILAVDCGPESRSTKLYIWRHFLDKLIRLHFDQGSLASTMDELFFSAKIPIPIVAERAIEEIKYVSEIVENASVSNSIRLSSVWSDDPRLRCSYPIDQRPIRIRCRLQDMPNWPRDDDSVSLSIVRGLLAVICREQTPHTKLYSDCLIIDRKRASYRITIDHPPREPSIKEQTVKYIEGIAINFSSYHFAISLCAKWLGGKFLLEDDPCTFDINETHEIKRFPCISMELICCRLYEYPDPFVEPPRQPHVAFLRFLYSLSNEDFRHPFLKDKTVFENLGNVKILKQVRQLAATSILSPFQSIFKHQIKFDNFDVVIDICEKKCSVPFRKYLLSAWSDLVEVFYDPYRPNKIGLLWKSSASRRKSQLSGAPKSNDLSDVISVWTVVGLGIVNRINLLRKPSSS